MASNFATIYEVGDTQVSHINCKTVFYWIPIRDFERFTTYHKSKTEDYFIVGNTFVPIL